MIKLFVTGDNHIGKKYDRYPQVKAQLAKSRLLALEDMVTAAEREGCHLFVVTGDLFDGINTISTENVEGAARRLAAFEGTVVILPGNHDYFTGEEQVWRDFARALPADAHHVVLLKEYRPYVLEAGGRTVTFYPAFCQSRHGSHNLLDWIRREAVRRESINIGIAHGTLRGVTPDLKEEYFPMTEQELSKIPMDLWLLGHTHVPWPADLKLKPTENCGRIFNPGTHEQTDLHNHTEGNGFVLAVEKEDDRVTVLAHKVISGRIRYFDIPLDLHPSSSTVLRERLTDVLGETAQMHPLAHCVLRITLRGCITREEYENRHSICSELLSGCMTYEVADEQLSGQITREMIRSTYAQTSFAARFLEELMSDPVKVQMAWELLQSCREDESA